MDIPHLIDEYNRTKREAGEPVMTQKRLAELAGVSESLVSLQVNGHRGITEQQEAAYRRILRVDLRDVAA